MLDNTPRGPSFTRRTTTASQSLARAQTPNQSAELIPLQAGRKRKSNANNASGVRWPKRNFGWSNDDLSRERCSLRLSEILLAAMLMDLRSEEEM